MQKSIIFLVLMLFIAFNSYAYMPLPFLISEHHGKIYYMTLPQKANVKSENDLTDYELKESDWLNIIKQGNALIAGQLLTALNQFLPNSKMQKYYIAGLNRIDSEKTKDFYKVANQTFRIMRDNSSLQQLHKIRTNTKYRDKMIPDVDWHCLFSSHNNKFETIEESIIYLSLNSPTDKGRQYEKNMAINKISKHNDSIKLESLINDLNFSIALGSWIALSKKSPQSMATKVLESALWREDELIYDYGTGCTQSEGKLIPIIAALDLFSDYLTESQIRNALLKVPRLWENQKIKSLTVRNQQTFDALKSFDNEALVITEYRKFLYSEQYNFVKKENVYDYINEKITRIKPQSIKFDQTLFDTLMNLPLSEYHENKILLLIKKAFQSKNAYAKKYINHLVTSDNLGIEPKLLARILLTSFSIWPQGWQDLKQHAIEKFKHHLPKDNFSYVPLSIKLTK